MNDQIYGADFKGNDAESDALHISQLATAGLAACDSDLPPETMKGALAALFEEIARKSCKLYERMDLEGRKPDAIKQDAA